ncbi:DNA repair protein RadC [Methylophaga sp.]|uniref:RadC family protein n=1 Tax=Methylophaga sp. TaxID=2024840 RepID=UPI00140109AD|nr:DNA repair protein RadC [Methylophaga sp.]MTI62828.1 JAB domain-containing protein [Methylophaga sp.]
MAIKDWPADDRPREKLLKAGAVNLSDAELLAIFLRTGVSGLSADDLARQLLSQFGSLRALLEADQTTFCQGHGLGTAKFVQLQAVLEMGRRHLESTLSRGDAFSDCGTTQLYLKQRLRHYPFEVFACLYLDNQHRLLHFEELFRGTIDGASVYPREVVKQALHHNAAAVILAHNHPSGVAEPSQADIQITKRIQSALQLVDIRVLDHIIVGDADTTSLAQQGQI